MRLSSIVPRTALGRWGIWPLQTETPINTNLRQSTFSHCEMTGVGQRRVSLLRPRGSSQEASSRMVSGLSLRWCRQGNS